MSKKHLSFAFSQLRGYLEGHEVPVLSVSITYRENSPVILSAELPISINMADFFDIVMRNRPMFVLTALHRNETQFIGEGKEYVMFIGFVDVYNFVVGPRSMHVAIYCSDFLSLLQETTIYDIDPSQHWLDINRIQSASQVTGSIGRFAEMVSDFIVNDFRNSCIKMLNLFGLCSIESDKELETKEISEGPISLSDEYDTVESCMAKYSAASDSNCVQLLGMDAVDLLPGCRELYERNEIGEYDISKPTKAYEQAWIRFTKYCQNIIEAARIFGIPPSVLFGIFCREGGSATASSETGAKGWMQIMPQTFNAEYKGYKKWMKSHGYGKLLKPSYAAEKNAVLGGDLDAALRFGAYLLMKNYNQTKDWRLAIMGYNAGVYGAIGHIVRNTKGDENKRLKDTAIGRGLLSKSWYTVYKQHANVLNYCNAIKSVGRGEYTHAREALSYVSMICGRHGYIELWNEFITRPEAQCKEKDNVKIPSDEDIKKQDDKLKKWFEEQSISGGEYNPYEHTSKKTTEEKQRELFKKLVDKSVEPEEKSTSTEPTEGINLADDEDKTASSLIDPNEILAQIKPCEPNLDASECILYDVPSTRFDTSRFKKVPFLGEFREFLIESIWIPWQTNKWKAYYAAFKTTLQGQQRLFSLSNNLWNLFLTVLDFASYQIVPIPGGALAYERINGKKLVSQKYPILWAIIPRITVVDYKEDCFKIPNQNIFYGEENPLSINYSVNLSSRITALAGTIKLDSLVNSKTSNNLLNAMRAVMPLSLAYKVIDSTEGDLIYRTTFTTEEEWRGINRRMVSYDMLEIGLTSLEQSDAGKSQGTGSNKSDEEVKMEQENLNKLIYQRTMRDYFEGVVGSSMFQFQVSYWPYIIVGAPAKFVAPASNDVKVEIYGVVTSVMFNWAGGLPSATVVLRNAYTSWDKPDRVFENEKMKAIDPWFSKLDFDNLKRFLLSIGGYKINEKASTNEKFELIDSERGRRLLYLNNLSAKYLRSAGRHPLRYRKTMNKVIREYSRFLYGIAMAQAWDLLGSTGSIDFTTTDPGWSDLESFTKQKR